MNIKLLTTLTIAILLFTACGDDSESSSKSAESQIKKKDFIAIIQHQDDCDISDKEKVATLWEEVFALRPINRDSLISFSTDNIQFCENYSRTFDYATCGVLNPTVAIEKSCITGFDFQK